MDIARAKALKAGQTVYCPADRGEPAYSGKVQVDGTWDYSAAPVQKNATGVEYIWVDVKGNGRTSVWPSNRLS
jgi:hypothetical protein